MPLVRFEPGPDSTLFLPLSFIPFEPGVKVEVFKLRAKLMNKTRLSYNKGKAHRWGLDARKLTL